MQLLTMIRAEVEDWLLVCASTKLEDRQGCRNALRFQGVSALDLMTTVYSKAAFCRTSAVYVRNALRVDFSPKPKLDSDASDDRDANVYE